MQSRRLESFVLPISRILSPAESRGAETTQLSGNGGTKWREDTERNEDSPDCGDKRLAENRVSES